MFTRCSLTSTFVSTSRDRYCVRLFTRCCHDDSPLTQPPLRGTVSCCLSLRKVETSPARLSKGVALQTFRRKGKESLINMLSGVPLLFYTGSVLYVSLDQCFPVYNTSLNSAVVFGYLCQT